MTLNFFKTKSTKTSGPKLSAKKSHSFSENGDAQTILQNLPENCSHLLRDPSGQYWGYNGRHWIQKSDEQILKIIFQHPVIKQSTSKNKLQRAKQIKGEIDLIVLQDSDPFLTSEKSPSIVNCMNGELWIDGEGKDIDFG